MARIKKDRVKDIAARVVRRPQSKRTPVIVRTGRKDVKTPEYGFDGKVDLWSFTLDRPAKRSNVRTGTVVGETMILEDVRVDAAVYRQNVSAHAPENVVVPQGRTVHYRTGHACTLRNFVG